MDNINFSNDFKIGFQDIDQQHFKIVTSINKIIDYYNNDVASKNIIDICDELLSDSYQHFAFEETLLDELGYPNYIQHAQIHLAFKDITTELILKNIDNQSEQISAEALEFMRNWWINHIQHEDMAFKDFLVEKLGN